MERNIRLVLSYDGTRYHGWQRQSAQPTLQGVLEDRIRKMVQEPVRVIGSGRTDAGVHALRQVCNFRTRSHLPIDTLRRGLNALLPEDICVHKAEEASSGFHSRYDARSKTYEYRILNGEVPDVFERLYVWHVQKPLDGERMRACLPFLLGTNDFSAFRSVGSGNTNPVRHVFRADLLGVGNPLLRFVIEADGFLRHMVRSIVGTLVDAGLGKMDAERFVEVLRSRDRQLAGIKAPAKGLFLVNVRYDGPRPSCPAPGPPEAVTS